MPDTTPSRGFAGGVLNLLSAGGLELTVTASMQVGSHYLRLGFGAGGLLSDRSVHSTMWITWFSDGDMLHQRR